MDLVLRVITNMKNMIKKIGLVLTVICITVLLTGCESKSKLSPDKFVDKMNEKGFEITNVMNRYRGNDDINNAVVAIKSNYKIEYFQFIDNEKASYFYENKKSAFSNYDYGTSNKSEVNINNYNKYDLTVNGRYRLISRIDNTVIYLDVEEMYKQDVSSIIEELGY